MVGAEGDYGAVLEAGAFAECRGGWARRGCVSWGTDGIAWRFNLQADVSDASRAMRRMNMRSRAMVCGDGRASELGMSKMGNDRLWSGARSGMSGDRRVGRCLVSLGVDYHARCPLSSPAGVHTCHASIVFSYLPR